MPEARVSSSTQQNVTQTVNLDLCRCVRLRLIVLWMSFPAWGIQLPQDHPHMQHKSSNKSTFVFNTFPSYWIFIHGWSSYYRDHSLSCSSFRDFFLLHWLSVCWNSACVILAAWPWVRVGKLVLARVQEWNPIFFWLHENVPEHKVLRHNRIRVWGNSSSKRRKKRNNIGNFFVIVD